MLRSQVCTRSYGRTWTDTHRRTRPPDSPRVRDFPPETNDQDLTTGRPPPCSPHLLRRKVRPLSRRVPFTESRRTRYAPSLPPSRPTHTHTLAPSESPLTAHTGRTEDSKSRDEQQETAPCRQVPDREVDPNVSRSAGVVRDDSDVTKIHVSSTSCLRVAYVTYSLPNLFTRKTTVCLNPRQ